MSRKTIITIGAALLSWAGSSAAQVRGTIEFGAFASVGRFDKQLTLDQGYGGGGRIGAYLEPRLSVEFEKGEMRATRTLGLRDVNVGILSARLVAVPIKSGALSILLGAGAGASTETNFMHTYGVNAMLGAKIALNDRAALRIEGIADWLANEDWKSYQRIQAGLSFYRAPHPKPAAVIPAAPCPQCVDRVSAEELARLRRLESDYLALRDSLGRPRPVPPPSSAAALATMEARIYFATDKSELSAEARAILDAKTPVFRANPAMRIIIVGNADARGADAYNLALGMRRAAAARDYLIAQGIDGARMEITSEGERKPADTATTAAAYASNRRDEFRLLLSSDYLALPKP